MDTLKWDYEILKTSKGYALWITDEEDETSMFFLDHTQLKELNENESLVYNYCKSHYERYYIETIIIVK